MRGKGGKERRKGITIFLCVTPPSLTHQIPSTKSLPNLQLTTHTPKFIPPKPRPHKQARAKFIRIFGTILRLPNAKKSIHETFNGHSWTLMFKQKREASINEIINGH